MSTLTKRGGSGGLVQRRNVASSHGAEGGKDVSDDPDHFHNHDNEDQDQDDKATRLTLMEEVLLLGLKDREVCSSVYTLCSFQSEKHFLMRLSHSLNVTRVRLSANSKFQVRVIWVVKPHYVSVYCHCAVFKYCTS